MQRRLLIGSVILFGLVGGAISVLSGNPSNEFDQNINLVKLANGSSEALYLASKDSTEECLKELNLDRSIPTEIKPQTIKIISQNMSNIIYFRFKNGSNEKNTIDNNLKAMEIKIDKEKNQLSKSDLDSLGRAVNLIADHSSAAGCIISKLRARN